MKTLLTLLFLAVIAELSIGRPVRVWSHAEMLEQADLVVIAKPISSRDTGETTSGHADWPALAGVTTTFEISSVLKGDERSKKVELMHYRLQKPSDAVAIIDGPGLLKLDLTEGHAYLLYLRRGGEKKYVPFSGSIDPGSSVLKLEGGHH